MNAAYRNACEPSSGKRTDRPNNRRTRPFAVIPRLFMLWCGSPEAVGRVQAQQDQRTNVKRAD